MTSTPEGERQYTIPVDALLFEIEEKLTHTRAAMDIMIEELKQERRLPSGKYKLDYDYLSEIIRKEIINK